MSDIYVQASFNSGEWSPKLGARVDLAKYKAGAALLENYFVDYRGGASTRPGTEYVIHAFRPNTQVRLIPFQVTFSVGYGLEFGDHYIRFIYNGAPLLEAAFAVTSASNTNPASVVASGNNYIAGDWVFLSGLGGATQYNNRYFYVTPGAGGTLTLADLNGNPIDATAFGAYTGGGYAQRIYVLASPFASAADLRLIKYAQSGSEMILCHPDYPTYVLTIIGPTNWTIAQIVIGSTARTPSNVAATSTLGSGETNYSYVVTSIDNNGQESGPSAAATLSSLQDIRTVAGSNSITWNYQPRATGYNVYESSVSYFGTVPSGVQYGYIGKATGTQFIDSNIGPDFSQSPPVAQNPFIGSGVIGVNVLVNGLYSIVPTVSFSGTSTTPASAQAILQAYTTPTISGPGSGFVVGDTVQFPGGIAVRVTAVGGGGAITAWTLTNIGSVSSGTTPGNPANQTGTTGAGAGAQASTLWGVGEVVITNPGAGYLATPTVVFSAGAAVGAAVLGANSNGNPSVPSFFQQRLVLAGPIAAPETFYLSRPGSYFNFDISDPTQPDDAITGTLVSGVLNTIKSIVSSTAGMLILTDKGSWLVNGGSSGAAVTPTAIVANAQSFVGASDVPPIVANYDVLYVQSKGSGVRDLAYNIYFNVFTGNDISVLASHLFFGYQIAEWAWAEQPFFLVWAIRSDGQMLTLTFLKDQDFTAWTHQTTVGAFVSVAAVTETTTVAGNVDAVYTVVEREVAGRLTQLIERVADRVYPTGVADAWAVDSGIQFIGAPATQFFGANHLAGLTVTGLADGQPIAPFVMPASGTFTLPVAASKVTIGVGFVARLKTLGLDVGDPSIQGKVKKIDAVTVRVSETLGLSIGPDFDHLVPMKDLVRGNVSSTLVGQESQVVTDLVTGDARTYLGAGYTTPGQYCIEQALPYPATILGVFPSITIGDTP